ncbi:MAG: hypothetical protein ACFFA3_07115 [Promethearchaeota archaeon]
MVVIVKCPNCGEEYSLGRKIFHECDGFSIHHGVVCHGRCKDYQWNCNSEKVTNQKGRLIFNDYLSNDEKYIESYKS